MRDAKAVIQTTADAVCGFFEHKAADTAKTGIKPAGKDETGQNPAKTQIKGLYGSNA